MRNAEDDIVGTVRRGLYNEILRGYTRKQWGPDPTELGPSVTARIPTMTNCDDRFVAQTLRLARRFGARLDAGSLAIETIVPDRDVKPVIAR